MATVKSVGWDVICRSEQPGIVRTQFLKTFDALKERDLRLQRTGAVPITEVVPVALNGGPDETAD